MIPSSLPREKVAAGRMRGSFVIVDQLQILSLSPSPHPSPSREREFLIPSTIMGEQQDYYRENEAYADFLDNWDAGFYTKYADALCPAGPDGQVLDVGCGVGQVVQRLIDAGHEAHGVEVSEPNIAKAKKVSDRCRLYDGRSLPFDDATFDSAGALNVLEHVEEPEAFITEIVRVVRPGGHVPAHRCAEGAPGRRRRPQPVAGAARRLDAGEGLRGVGGDPLGGGDPGGRARQ